MKNTLFLKHLLKNHWPRILSVIFFILLSISYVKIFAIGSPYAPGATLDPACAPGDANCIVQVIPANQTSNMVSSNGLITNGTNGDLGGGGLLGSTSTLGTETWLGTDPATMGTASTTNTVFIGINAGQNATSAASSIFIGNNAGLNDLVDNVTIPGTSILIGDNTSTGGFQNSIAIGAGAVNTAENQFLIAPSYTNLNIGGIDYVVPASQGAVNSVLTNDGSGGLSWGTISIPPVPAARTAGDIGIGYLNYNGTTQVVGQLDGGTTNPSHSNRLNYDGNFYANSLVTNSMTVSGNILPTIVPTSNITYIDTTGDVGSYSSIALGSDGFARISYYDQTNGHLKFAQCTNIDCTTKNITSVDATNGAVGYFSSLILGSDGFARIAYFDNTIHVLKFAQCTNDACTTKNITIVDSSGNVGQNPSITLGSDGYARIAYYDVANADLKFAQCTNASCTTKNITSVDTAGNVGQYYISIALGSDGFARISYYDVTNGDLKFAQCTNDSCTTKNTTTVDSTGNVGYEPSMALDSDGFARIAYFDLTNTDLKFAQCTNDGCTTKNITTVDSSGSVGWYPSITLGSDGFARISYFDDTSSGRFKLAKCTSADCTTKNITTVDTHIGVVGEYDSIALGSDGFARISYYDSTNGDLKFFRDTGAIPTFITGSDIGSLTTPFNNIYSTYMFSKQSLVGYFDMAENYPTKDSNLSAGYIVSLDKDNPVFVKKALNTDRIIGIVSTMPGSLLGGYNDELYVNENKVPIALSGRVPVKVDLENGPISQGDDISLSSTAGIGKKAKPGEDTVGIALESYDGTSSDNSILVFVHLQTSLSDLNLKVADLSSLDTTNATSLGSLIKEFLGDQANDIADLYAKAIHSDSVETNNLKTKELCVGNACVKEEQFLEIINKNVTTQTAPSPADTTSAAATEPDTTTPTTVPTIDNSAPDPAAVPPVSPDPVPSDAALTAPVQ